MSNPKKRKKKYSGKRHSIEQKRRRIAEQKRAKKNTTLMIVAIGMIIVAAIAFGINYSQSKKNQVGGTEVGPTQNYSQAEKVEMTDIDSVVENGKITTSLKAIKDNTIVGFQYKGEQEFPLLAYISPSGKLVTAVSMCEPCKSTRFHIEGDQLVCNACGTRWILNTLKGISGGCVDYPPDEVSNDVQGDKVLIDEKIIKEWKPRA